MKNTQFFKLKSADTFDNVNSQIVNFSKNVFDEWISKCDELIFSLSQNNYNCDEVICQAHDQLQIFSNISISSGSFSFKILISSLKIAAVSKSSTFTAACISFSFSFSSADCLGTPGHCQGVSVCYRPASSQFLERGQIGRAHV